VLLLIGNDSGGENQQTASVPHLLRPLRVSVGMLRRTLIILAAFAVVPGGASAATAGYVYQPPLGGGNTLIYAAEPGETNQVSFAADGPAVVIRDAGASITAGSGCMQLAAQEVSCAATPAGASFRVQVDLGDGDDRAVIGPVNAIRWDVGGGVGDDTLDASAAAGRPTRAIALGGGPGSDRLVGSEGRDDGLFGGPGADRIEGRGGDDALEGDDATVNDDVLDGGAGSDLIDYRLRAEPVTVDLAAGVGGAAGERDHLISIENAGGGSASDDLHGDAGPNILGGAQASCGAGVVPPGTPGPPPVPIAECLTRSPIMTGGDALIGRDGDDRILGTPRADRLAGGNGNDRLRHPDRRDRVECGSGLDPVDLADGDPGASHLGVVGPPFSRGCDRFHLSGYFRVDRPAVRGRFARARVSSGEAYGGRCGAGLELRSRRGALLGRARWRSRSDVRRRVAIPLSATGRRLARRHAWTVLTQLRYIGGIPGNRRPGLTCFEDGLAVDAVRIRL
jgi:RTX calcium-binding nonapeptide repeat (4 copies)